MVVIIRQLAQFWPQICATCIVSLSYLSIGLVRAWASTSVPSFNVKELSDGEENPDALENAPLDVDIISWIVAGPPIGAIIGSILVTLPLRLLGRRATLIIAGLGFITGNSLIAGGGWVPHTITTPLLIAGRIILGLSVGFSCPATVIYVSETTSPSLRGTLGCVPALQMALGILIGYIIGAVISWKLLTCISLIFPIILIIGCMLIPESPVWLNSKGRYVASLEASKWLHLDIHSKPKLDSAKLDSNCVVKPTSDEQQEFEIEPSTTISVMSRPVLLPLCLSLGLQFVQIWSGVNVLIFKTVEIFDAAGSAVDAFVATAIVGIVQLVATAVSIPLVDMAGRKPLLMISSSIMAVAMGVLGACFFVGGDNLGDDLGWLPLAAVVTAFIGFSIGYAGIPFLVMGELFPSSHRSMCGSISSMFNLLNLFLTLKFFTQMVQLTSYQAVFWLFGGVNAVGTIAVYFFLPETKGKKLEEIEQYFKSKN